MQEINIANLDSGNFRLQEAEFFLGGYIGNSGPHADFFSMVCLLDAFLYTLISIEEVVSPFIRDTLYKKDVFVFEGFAKYECPSYRSWHRIEGW